MKHFILPISILLFLITSSLLYAADPPKYRGAMISPSHFGPEDIDVFAGQWKGNLVRWQLNCGFPHGWGDTATLEEYSDWLDREMAALDKMLPLLNQYQVKVCLDLHTPPGGSDENTVARVFRDEKFADAFVEVWERLAAKYKDEPAIWAYDLMNEPVVTAPEVGTDPVPWRTLMERAAKKIRKIDAETPIIFEPPQWAHAAAFKDLEPFDIPNAVYSFHQYVPIKFTHQLSPKDTPYVYPGEIQGVYWDKEEIRKSMQPVIEFQQKYNVPIFVGEFSAIRWAPDNSAYRYLSDVIELFEEYGWDWTYHAFREWSGWSVEYSTDREDKNPAGEPTDREILLRSWFEKND